MNQLLWKDNKYKSQEDCEFWVEKIDTMKYKFKFGHVIFTTDYIMSDIDAVNHCKKEYKAYKVRIKKAW